MQLSPHLSPFEWFHAFGEFINRSAVASPTLESDNIPGLLRAFVGFVPTYELQREYTNHLQSLQIPHDCPHCWISSAMDDIGEIFDREQDQKKAQALLGIATNDYLGAIDRKGCDAPPPIPCEDWHTNRLWIAKMFPIVHTVVQACHLYSVTGKNEEATILLEHLASNAKLETPETYKTGAGYLYVMVSLALRFVASNQDEKAAGLSIEPFNIPTSVENADTIDFNATFVDRGGLCEDHECEKAEALRYADYDMDTAGKIQAYDKLHEYLLDELLQQAPCVPFEVGSGAASLSTRLQQDSDAVQGSRRSHPQLETSGHCQGCLGLGTVFLADAMERDKECDWKLDDSLQP